MLPAGGCFQPDPTKSSGDWAAPQGKSCLEAKGQPFCLFPYPNTQRLRETGNSLSVSPSVVADCPHLLEREEGKQVQLLKPDGSCDGRSFGREVWLWVLEASTGDPSVAPTLSITHSLKQLRYFQYKEYRLAGFFLGFLYEVINHCTPLPSFHWLRTNQGWGESKVKPSFYGSGKHRNYSIVYSKSKTLIEGLVPLICFSYAPIPVDTSLALVFKIPFGDNPLKGGGEPQLVQAHTVCKVGFMDVL